MNWASNVVVHVVVLYMLKIKKKEVRKYMDIYVFIGHVSYL